jgi:hypothetical protein
VAARLEERLAATSNPRAALQDLVRQSGWNATEAITDDDPAWSPAPVRQALESETARHERDDDSIVSALREGSLESGRWVELGKRRQTRVTSKSRSGG